MSGQMILTVQQAHHLRPWRTLRPKIIMANTGAPQFDEAERLYEVGAWGNWDSKWATAKDVGRKHVKRSKHPTRCYVRI